MLNLRKVAVTGGLASGKTAVCRILESYGAYVVSADEIVRQLLISSTEIGQQVISELGPDIITNNQIDRAKIAKKVFSHPDKLQALEKILHPAVIEEIERQYQQVKDFPKYKFFVAEVPLLYESESEGRFDVVIAVIADPAICQKRFQNSKGYPLEEYKRRMIRQIPQDQKAANADFILSNNGSMEDLKSSVASLIPKLVSN